MLCSNQEMLRAVYAFLADAPPIICDWCPWNHTAGGNHNFGLVLYNGGTLYIDEGKPTPALFAATVRNLREIPCTAHFTVPRFYEMLMPHLRSDAVLRQTFFSDLKLLFYAAAGLGQRFWDELRDVAMDACGEEIFISTGLGATETAPFAIATGTLNAFAGMIGLPAPGMELKLVPVESKMEGRVRGPNITPGYWRDEALTAAAFDEEGFYRLGDAMAFADPARSAEGHRLQRPHRRGLQALDRNVGQRRTAAGEDSRPGGRPRPGRRHRRPRSRVRDGADLSEPAPVPRVAPASAPMCPLVTCCPIPLSSAGFTRCSAPWRRRARAAPRSSRARSCLTDPPSMEAREITDKGSINQKAVLKHRAALVDEMYAVTPPAHVLVSRQPAAAATPNR